MPTCTPRSVRFVASPTSALATTVEAALPFALTSGVADWDNRRGRSVLQEVSRQTGGRFFRVGLDCRLRLAGESRHDGGRLVMT